MSYKNIFFSEIAEWFKRRNGTVKNFGLKDEHVISYPRAIEISDESNISILTRKYEGKAMQMIAQTACKLIIIPDQLLVPERATQNKAFLIHDNPKQVLIDFCKEFLAFDSPNSTAQIHSTAIIEQGARIGENNWIGANVFVSADSEIANNCTIGQNTVIKNCTIGDNTKIGSNTTIGENGFGYSRLENDEIELFPHYGRVIVEADVHIGNNTCIDRGSLSDTIIERGVKIDNLVHIAHNVRIGENSLIIACSMIAGSVSIGRNSWVSPSSAIRNAVTLGENVMVGLASTVTKSVADNQTVIGSPALPQKDFFILNKQQKEILIRLKSERKSSE